MTGPSLRDLAFLRNPLPAIIVDGAARVVDANDAYLEMTRRARDELVGEFSVNFIHADDLALTLAGFAELEAGARFVRQRRRHLRGDGTWITVDALSSAIAIGDDHMMLVQLIDLSDAVDIQEGAEAETRLQLMPFGDGACFHDPDGRMLFVTANLAELLGRPVAWLYGRRLTDPDLHAMHADGRPVTPDEDPAVEALRLGTDVIRTIGLRTVADEVVWLSVRSGPVDSARLPARSTLRDISDLIRAQEEARMLAALVERELAHRADHDSLTELKARHVIVEAIGSRLDRGAPVSVVFVDIDGFKAVNDDYGHLIGDEALVAVARNLEALAPPAATLGRNGGDEFVAVFDEPAAAERFAADVHGRVLTNPPIRPLRASVGVAHSEPGDTVRRLLQRADDAMYAAKRAAGTS